MRIAKLLIVQHVLTAKAHYAQRDEKPLSEKSLTSGALDPKYTVYEESTGGSDYVNLVGKGLMNGRAYYLCFNLCCTD